METFNFKNKNMFCEGVKVEILAKKFGTPLYITSKNHIRRQSADFKNTFSEVNPLVCYAVKANYNLSILRVLREAGSGAEVGSKGELFRALKAGITPKKIVMSGVGKTKEDIIYALKKKILLLKVESLSEIQQINIIAKKLGIIAPIAIRINPDVRVDTHASIATGAKEHKFGIDEGQVLRALAWIKQLKQVNLLGLAIHIGSQVASPQSYVQGINTLLKYKSLAEKEGYSLTYLDCGGGFPITYKSACPKKSIKEFARAIIPLLKNSSVKIIFEPGRYLVAQASILVTTVLSVKKNSQRKNFIVVDAGLTELMRPALYDAYHEIVPVKQSSRPGITADIVGPVCESTDIFAKKRKINSLKEREMLAILAVGAYGGVMASNYNGHLRCPEILVDGRRHTLIRKRETLKQIIQNEI